MDGREWTGRSLGRKVMRREVHHHCDEEPADALARRSALLCAIYEGYAVSDWRLCLWTVLIYYPRLSVSPSVEYLPK